MVDNSETTVSDAPLDPRRHAYRDGLAAEILRGKVTGVHFTSGEVQQVVHSATPLRATPESRGGWTTEALFGELVTVYDERDGWAWVQLERDRYVGYVRASSLSHEVNPATHRVNALGTFLYAASDIKSAPWMQLSMNARLAVVEMGQAFARLLDGSFVPSRHISELQRFQPDFVAVAERFIGVPYLWGGKSRLGVDCSGLLQVAMEAAGLDCPRDSDMQLAELGRDVPLSDKLDGLARGDIVFWKDHVGIMTDPFMLLHANAHHMLTVVEPVATAAERIRKRGSSILAIKRLPARTAPTPTGAAHIAR